MNFSSVTLIAIEISMAHVELVVAHAIRIWCSPAAPVEMLNVAPDIDEYVYVDHETQRGPILVRATQKINQKISLRLALGYLINF